MNRKEVNDLLSLYTDLLDASELLRTGLYMTGDSFDDESVYSKINSLNSAIIDLGELAKEMDDKLLAKEMKVNVPEHDDEEG